MDFYKQIWQKARECLKGSFKMRTDLAKMNESIDLTIELVLNDVIEGLQQEEDQMVVLRSRKQEQLVENASRRWRSLWPQPWKDSSDRETLNNDKALCDKGRKEHSAWLPGTKLHRLIILESFSYSKHSFYINLTISFQ